MSTNTRSN